MANDKTRLGSLDVMRGITVAAMILFNNPGSGNPVFAPLRHAQWNGLTLADFAYPFFVFMMGVSICFSLRRFKDNRAAALPKVFRRTVVLYAIGLFLVSFRPLCSGTFSLESIRILGVLQRLAIVYLAGALCFLYVPGKALPWIAAVLLAAYVAILNLFGGYAHDATNFVSKVDVLVLGAGHLITENGVSGRFPFEPEGIVSTIPCVSHIIFGILAGKILVSGEECRSKALRISVLGSILLGAGCLLGFCDPVNKKLWTSSFTLVTCGAASLMLSLLMNWIDMKGDGSRGGFFKVLGANALFSYVLSSVLSTIFKLTGVRQWFCSNVTDKLFGWAGGEFCSLTAALCFVLLIWLLALPLYRKKIYIKI